MRRKLGGCTIPEWSRDDDVRSLDVAQHPESRQYYGIKDRMFYASSLGLGIDPLDPTELEFTYERNFQVVDRITGELCSCAHHVPMPLGSLLYDRFLRLLAGGGNHLDWSAIGGLAALDAGDGRRGANPPLVSKVTGS